MADEMVPFLTIRDNISAIYLQITDEEKLKKYRSFIEIIENPAITALISNSNGENTL